MESFDNRDEVTSFENICSILSELWMNYKEDKDFEEFIQYNDLGLPLAFLIDSEIVKVTEQAEKYILETWTIFLSALNIDNDLGWKSLNDLFHYIEKRNNK